MNRIFMHIEVAKGPGGYVVTEFDEEGVENLRKDGLTKNEVVLAFLRAGSRCTELMPKLRVSQ